jgi:hypothetical protein
MTNIVEPKPEFRALTEAQVRAALEDPNPVNPIAIEISRLVAGYAANLKAHVERLGYVPADILHLQGRWPIETVAMQLMTQAIREAVPTG